MPKMIQIRNVPDHLHRTLKARAAGEGLSLSEYLLREIRWLAARPTVGEWLERVQQRPGVRLPVSTAAAIRTERESR
jgi:plasmid stability protein